MARAEGWRRVIALVALLLVGGALGSCDRVPKRTFTILTGSENRPLEPIVTDYCKLQRWICRMRYVPSIEISRALAEPQPDMDAVWPASHLWLDLSDGDIPVRHVKPILRSPIVVALPAAIGTRLDLLGKPVPAAAILAQVKAGALTWMSPSAVQANSGMLGYLLIAMALAGGSEALDEDRLADPAFQAQLSTWLAGQTRSGPGISWLQAAAVETDAALVAPEAALIAINRDRVAAQRPPLVAINLAEGALAVDSPLGFVARNQRPEAESFFLNLQRYLLSEIVQTQLRRMGFRPVIPLQPNADPGAFDAAVGLDPQHPPRLLQSPPVEVVRQALQLYQEQLRKPSLTLWCLDMSGSMEGDRLEALRAAFHTLFDPDSTDTGAALTRATAHDVGVVIPFSGEPWGELRETGPEGMATLAHQIDGLDPGGGTDIYACLDRALTLAASDPSRAGALPAIVVVTDGGTDDPDGAAKFAARYQADGAGIPIVPIALGDLDPTTLDGLAKLGHAKVLDGRTDLTKALSEARAIN